MADTDSISVIIAFFRFSGISLFLLLGALMLRDFSTSRQVSWLGAWAALSGAAYLVCTSPALNHTLGSGMVVVQIFCHTGQIAIWLFSLSQFRDKLNIWPRYALLGVLFYLLGRLDFEVLRGDGSFAETFVRSLYTAMRFGLIGHMVYVAWEGRGDDLIEARRKFRLVYIVTVSLTVLLVSGVETFFSLEVRAGEPMLLLQSIGMWLLATILVWQGINLKTVVISAGKNGRGTDKKTAPNDPNERHDLETINRLVEQENLFLRPGLTIASLADEAGFPEHRLRRLINRHLGYRNFADFLNHYRINAAQARLASVSERNVPVLTIAMELGYGSLGPFNRAFKERTGVTPTEYRRKQLADS